MINLRTHCDAGAAGTEIFSNEGNAVDGLDSDGLPRVGCKLEVGPPCFDR